MIINKQDCKISFKLKKIKDCNKYMETSSQLEMLI